MIKQLHDAPERAAQFVAALKRNAGALQQFVPPVFRRILPDFQHGFHAFQFVLNRVLAVHEHRRCPELRVIARERQLDGEQKIMNALFAGVRNHQVKAVFVMAVFRQNLAVAEFEAGGRRAAAKHQQPDEMILNRLVAELVARVIDVIARLISGFAFRDDNHIRHAPGALAGQRNRMAPNPA